MKKKLVFVLAKTNIGILTCMMLLYGGSGDAGSRRRGLGITRFVNRPYIIIIIKICGDKYGIRKIPIELHSDG